MVRFQAGEVPLLAWSCPEPAGGDEIGIINLMEAYYMVTKADFTAEEWQQVLVIPQLASIVIVLASPSGAVGLTKEMMASSKLIMEAMKASTGNALIDAVAADLKEMAERKEKLQPPQISKERTEAIHQCLQACRDVAALLAQKAPEEADGFKHWVYTAAKLTAEAGKEGGFMGIGGERVSEGEVLALNDVAHALGITV
jgi:hypothetical protein